MPRCEDISKTSELESTVIQMLCKCAILTAGLRTNWHTLIMGHILACAKLEGCFYVLIDLGLVIVPSDRRTNGPTLL